MLKRDIRSAVIVHLMNVIRIAANTGIRRVVVTSTAGILGPSENTPVNESTPPPASFFTPYEESKFRLEQQLLFRKEKDPEVIIVNPTRVFGPGYLSESNGVIKMIKQYMGGSWKFVPGDGNSAGNYVYVEDVVSGHLLAMEKGRPGERYVLGGENISYNELFQSLREISEVQKRLYRVPVWIMLTIATLMRGVSILTGKPPMIVPGLVRKFNQNWIVSSDKAKRELGYDPISIYEGLSRTVKWIKSLSVS